MFVSPERLGQALHFSLHENEAYWQFTVDIDGEPRRRQQWTPLPPTDGARRALTIEIRPALIHVPVRESGDRVHIYAGTDNPNNTLLIELHLLDGDLPVLQPLGSGPTLLGGVRMVDGRAGVLLASEWTPPDDEGSISPGEISDDMASQMRQAASAGNLGLMVFLRLSDGSLKITDLRTRPD